jgi:transcriptional regulator with XRE-family HTH domain
MDSLKLTELRSRVTLTALARASSISRQQMDNIIKRKSLPPLETARRLASNACRLTGLEIYEPHDFNPNLNPALKNLCDDVRFRITYLDVREDEVGTVKELIGDEPDDLELLQAMHECVWDGARRLIHHPDRLIELED